jgi:hypothetical protein
LRTFEPGSLRTFEPPELAISRSMDRNSEMPGERLWHMMKSRRVRNQYSLPFLRALQAAEIDHS